MHVDMVRTVMVSSHLSSCASHSQIAAVFTEVDLLNAQPRVVAVGVETADLDNNRYNSNLVMTSSGFIFSDVTNTKALFCRLYHRHTYLPEWRPLSLGALVHVVVGVGVCVEHSSCAQLIHGMQTDS